MLQGRYEEILGRFADRHVLVVGDLMVDEYVTGQVNRISPESPVMIVEVESEEHVPGGAANVVNNLTALGARVSIIGLVGQDAVGDRLRRTLADRGVNVEGIVTDPTRPTTVKTRILAQHRQLLRVDRELTAPVVGEPAERLARAFSAALPDADAVLISDYNKGIITEETGRRIVEASRGAHRFMAANPKPATALRLKGVDVMTLNLIEAEGLAGVKFTTEALLRENGARLAQLLDVRVLFITQGSRGLMFWERGPEGTQMTQVPAHTVDVYDVAGAGDTAVSALTLAMTSGAATLEAAMVANHAAACVVRKVGVATVAPEELLTDWAALAIREPSQTVPG